jgi:hypothetical protein
MIKCLLLAIVLLYTSNVYSTEILVVTVFKTGEVFYQRGDKELPVNKGQVFEKKDKIQTKNGFVDLQVGTGSVLRIGKFSSLVLSELFEEKGTLKVELNLNIGSVFTKVVKKMDKTSEFKIKTPTQTAGVRGTQFLIKEGNDSESEKEDEKIEGGVYVIEGEVEVITDYATDPISVKAGEEILTANKNQKVQILDTFVKEKMKILETLNVMKEVNYKNLQEQYQKNKDTLKR